MQSEKCVRDEKGLLASYIDKYPNDGLMRAARDKILKHHQEELLGKSTGNNSMLERTVGADAEVVREGICCAYSCECALICGCAGGQQQDRRLGEGADLLAGQQLHPEVEGASAATSRITS